MTSSVFTSWVVMMSPSFHSSDNGVASAECKDGHRDGPLASIEGYYQRVKGAKDKCFIILTEGWSQWHAARSVRL